jgi:hypothetical protein
MWWDVQLNLEAAADIPTDQSYYFQYKIHVGNEYLCVLYI